MSEIKRLGRLFVEHRGKIVDKWEQYIGVYEQELRRFLEIDAPVRLLEIGVQNGGSLEIWHDFLPPQSSILGIDINSRVAELSFGEKNIRVEVCDATDGARLGQVLGGKPFDIIIDDGSHLCKDVRISFGLLYDWLSPGGLYIIEDLHCSYRADFGGGLQEAASSVEFLKGLIDWLNIDHISPEEIKQADRTQSEELGRTLGRIAFYDSVAVIEKLATEKTRPYRRILSGSENSVESTCNMNASIRATGRSNLLLSYEAAQRFETVFVDKPDTERDRRNQAGLAPVDRLRQQTNILTNALQGLQQCAELLRQDCLSLGGDDGAANLADIEASRAIQVQEINTIFSLIASAEKALAELCSVP